MDSEWTTLGKVRAGLCEDRSGIVFEKLGSKPDRIGYIEIKIGSAKQRMWHGLPGRAVEMAPRQRKEADSA